MFDFALCGEIKIAVTYPSGILSAGDEAVSFNDRVMQHEKTQPTDGPMRTSYWTPRSAYSRSGKSRLLDLQEAIAFSSDIVRKFERWPMIDAMQKAAFSQRPDGDWHYAVELCVGANRIPLFRGNIHVVLDKPS